MLQARDMRSHLFSISRIPCIPGLLNGYEVEVDIGLDRHHARKTGMSSDAAAAWLYRQRACQWSCWKENESSASQRDLRIPSFPKSLIGNAPVFEPDRRTPMRRGVLTGPQSERKDQSTFREKPISFRILD